MNTAIEPIKRHVTDNNVETLMYLNLKEKFCVRVRDLDAGENVVIYVCKDLAQAQAKFDKAIEGGAK